MNVVIDYGSGTPFFLEVGFLDTVLEVKQKIEKDQGIPISKQKLYHFVFLRDDLTIQHYKIVEHSRIYLVLGPESDIHRLFYMLNTDFFLREDNSDTDLALDHSLSEVSTDLVLAPPSPSGPSKVARYNLKVTVLTACGMKKIPMEVNAWNNVEVLKKEMEKLLDLKFDLPGEVYIFFHNQEIMIDSRSFLWHQVRKGDTIQIIRLNTFMGFMPKRIYQAPY